MTPKIGVLYKCKFNETVFINSKHLLYLGKNKVFLLIEQKAQGYSTNIIILHKNKILEKNMLSFRFNEWFEEI